MTKSNFKKISYDVILETSWPLCHWKTSPKNVTNFLYFAYHSQSKFLATPVVEAYRVLAYA